jgi:hypothetical protein
VINETVLEMHYHKPLMDLFRETFGVGKTGAINFYKYSPQRECFIGFDQAYAMTDLPEKKFFDLLKDAASSKNYKLKDKFVGYFLQFKVMKPMQKQLKHTPASITNKPHFRTNAPLETAKDITVGFSQHELLYNLNQNAGAMVYYACPMLFDQTDLYEVNVDLDRLRLADLNTCPSSYGDNESHHIYFNEIAGNPVWCSDPVDGKAVSPRQFAERVLAWLRERSPAHSARELLTLLTDLPALGVNPDSELFDQRLRNILPLVAEALTIIRISFENPEK